MWVSPRVWAPKEDQSPEIIEGLISKRPPPLAKHISECVPEEIIESRNVYCVVTQSVRTEYLRGVYVILKDDGRFKEGDSVELRYALRKGPNNYVYVDLTKSYGPSNNGTGRWHVATATPDQMRLETPLGDFYCKIRDIALLNGEIQPITLVCVDGTNCANSTTCDAAMWVRR